MFRTCCAALLALAALLAAGPPARAQDPASALPPDGLPVLAPALFPIGPLLVYESRSFSLVPESVQRSLLLYGDGVFHYTEVRRPPWCLAAIPITLEGFLPGPCPEVVVHESGSVAVAEAQALWRRLRRLGAARLRGPQPIPPFLVPSQPLRRITFFRPVGPERETGELARANTFSFSFPTGTLGPIAAAIDGFIDERILTE